jgi:hypothetical protein
MSRESSCRCLLCALERSLTDQFARHACAEAYRHFADSHSLLSAFPSELQLIGYLHSGRDQGNGTYPADRIVAELLEAAASGDAVVARDLLLLAFIPMLHSTSRQVASRYPSLASDDIAQHAVTALLQIIASAEFYGRGSHVAFAISRVLKRKTFEWAERECRPPVFGAFSESFGEAVDAYDSSETVERTAVLRHFLHRCHQRGFLSGEDMELLVQFKLDAARDRKQGGPAALYSNAARQRMKRILSRLRRIARNLPNRQHDDAQLRLF